MYVVRTGTAEIMPFAAHFCDTSPSSNPLGTDFAADLTTIYLSRHYRYSAIRPSISANRRLLKCGTGGIYFSTRLQKAS
jgi:hypothetical protein